MPEEQTGKVINETLEISPAKLPVDCAKAMGEINEPSPNANAAAKILIFMLLLFPPIRDRKAAVLGLVALC